jgi:hypothetical protein
MRPRRHHRFSTDLVVLAAANLAALTGCGQIEQDGERTVSATAAGKPSGATGGASAGGMGSLGGGAEAGLPGEAGAAAAGPQAEPARIAGRWGLFVFEDPVGVQLTQDGSTLGGEGCAAGAPPLMDGGLDGFCGPISGRVEGRSASFHFNFESYVYSAQVVVDESGAQRMTGAFHGVGPVSWPTAWLPVPPGAPWLASRPVPDPLSVALRGGYRLEPIPGSPPDAPAEVELWYFEEGVASGLGSFFHSELRRDEAGTIWAGPVPATSPELAVLLELVTTEDAIVTVRATLADGRELELGAERM